MSRSRFIRCTAVWAAFCGSLTAGCNSGGAGFLGLQDYQRDLLFGLGGGLAGALLDNFLPAPPVDDSARDVVGAAGPQGPAGPAGPPLFSVFVDSFYNGVVDDALGVVPLAAADPKFAPAAGTVAFSIAIPTTYVPSQPIMMRIVLFRTGACDGGCFAFTVDARRATLGSAVVDCFGGSGDCAGGTRFVHVPDVCVDVPEDSVDAREFLVIDLPIGATGLDLPTVNAGDLIAFEVSAAVLDGGEYHVLGVEFTDAAGDQLRNAVVYKSLADLPAGCVAAQ